MNILWLVNIVYPEVYVLLGRSYSLKGTGGWLVAAAESISGGVEKLTVVCSSDIVKEITSLKGAFYDYIVIPSQKQEAYYKHQLHKIKDKVQPDIVHIHGTEIPLGNIWIKEFGPDNVVLSIQGVMSAVAEYHHRGLSNWDILSSLTFHDLIRETIWGEHRFFIRKSKKERELIERLKYVIGRTSFDRAYINCINPQIRYFHCDESLRDDFYDGCWKYDSCTKHSIFLSQAQAPLKGLHFLLKAMPLVIKRYPDAVIRIGGHNIIKKQSIHDRIRLTGYGRFIQRMIIKYGLQKHVFFLGPLNAKEMKSELLRANSFVCPSTIENSPNSVGEAQLLGVPCVCSDAGGIPDFVSNNQTGVLYRYDDSVMLAYRICQSFEASSTFDNSAEREIAARRHDKHKNGDLTLEIYKQISSMQY